MHPHLTHRPRRMVIFRCGLPPLALEPRIARSQFLYFIFFWRGRRYLASGPRWRFCGALTGAAEERSGRAAQDRRHAKSGSALKFRERPRPHRHRLSKRQKPRHLPPRAGKPNESRKISNRRRIHRLKVSPGAPRTLHIRRGAIVVVRKQMRNCILLLLILILPFGVVPNTAHAADTSGERWRISKCFGAT